MAYRKWDDWASQLPAVWNFLQEDKIKAEESKSAKTWYVLAAEMKDDKLSLSGDFQSLEKEVYAALEAMDWDVSQGTVSVVVAAKKFVVAAVSKLDVMAKSKSRDFGINVSEFLAAKKADYDVSFAKYDALSTEDVLHGFLVALDQGGQWFTKDNVKLPSAIYVASLDKDTLVHTKVWAEAKLFCKFLQDGPANVMNPQTIPQIVNDIFKSSPVSVETMGLKDIEKEKMWSMLSVSDGSDIEPHVVTVHIKGEDSSKKVALIGKGVTFDSGGINIKTAMLEDMKFDMSGSAAVLGAAYYFSKVKPKCDVICSVGLSENMLNGLSSKPGDVVKTKKGKTVEIINTDAEGRLVLVDVMAYIQEKHKPTKMVDIATLTGAVIFGLGHAGSAVVSNKPEVANQLIEDAKAYGEPLWQLPIFPELRSSLKSHIADLTNLAPRMTGAGTVTAGIFLSNFVDTEEMDWIHVDIAGTAWNCSATGYHKKGGSAFGMATLIAAVEKN